MNDAAPESVTGPIDGPDVDVDARSLPFGLTKGQLTGLLIVAGICGGVMLALWFTKPKGLHAEGNTGMVNAQPLAYEQGTELCTCDAAPEPHLHDEALAFVPPEE